MRCFDVFNGDADGICALRQLRLAEPREAVLVTGLKRDIELVKRAHARAGDQVTVLDVSLERNREAVQAVLAAGASVRYFDHHAAGEVPRHPCFDAHLDESPMTCTSTLVDRFLGGRFRAWAVAGAFGDNLPELAGELAHSLALDADAVESLRALGESINYNAYGETLDDVLVARGELYRNGTFANRLALAHPERAHAVVTPRGDGGFAVSVRAPRTGGASSVEFCRGFASGGGRALAGGIERLAHDRLEAFLEAFAAAWPG
jgi:hypothetical protein